MRELAYMDRLFKQQERLQKQRERILGIKREESEEKLEENSTCWRRVNLYR